MKKKEIPFTNIETYIASFYNYALLRTIQLGIVDSYEDDVQRPIVSDSIESYWYPIDSFVHALFKKKYPDQINIVPIVSGQITAYAGIVAAFLWFNNNTELTKNIVKDKENINSDGELLINFLNINFISPFSYSVHKMLEKATDIDDIQKFFLHYIGLSLNSKEEKWLRAGINNICSDIFVTISNETNHRHNRMSISLVNNFMKLMFKLGITIGAQKYH